MAWRRRWTARRRGLHGQGARGRTSRPAHLRHVEQHEPVLWRNIRLFYAAVDLGERPSLGEALGEHILAPVGWLRRRGEVLAFGSGAPSADLPAVGRRFLAALLAQDGAGAPAAPSGDRPGEGA